jgi:hypothetical protein
MTEQQDQINSLQCKLFGVPFADLFAMREELNRLQMDWITPEKKTRTAKLIAIITEEMGRRLNSLERFLV